MPNDTALNTLNAEAGKHGLRVRLSANGMAYVLVRDAFVPTEIMHGTKQDVTMFLRGYSAAQDTNKGRYLLVLVGDVDPELQGPFPNDDARLEAARAHRAEYGDEDGLYRLEAGPLGVTSFFGFELRGAS